MKINAFFKKIKLVFKKLFNSNKKMFVLSVLLCFVVFLLFFSSLSSTNKTTTKSSSKITKYTVSEYSSFIENKIEEMIFSTGKVNRVSAFVMVESTPEIKVRPDFCRRLPSDSTSRWTHLPLAICFPSLGRIRDFHPLEHAHAGRTRQPPDR